MTTMTLPRPKAVRNPLTYIETQWLKVWTFAHIILLVVIYQLDSMSHRTFDQTIQSWDANLLQNVAQHGYFSGSSSSHTIAFFPGYPIALSAVHLLTTNWVVAELLLSYVAGGVTLVGLARLQPGAPRMMLMSPAAIFLMLGYSESLYLAFAVWAWIYASKREYWVCSLLLAYACSVRVDGLFLWLALMVVHRSTKLLVGLLIPAMYELYLKSETGDWMAWTHAQAAGWGRHTHMPWTTWKTSWSYAGWAGGSYGGEEKVEILCAILLVVMTAVFAVDRDWSAMIYCGITTTTLITSTMYMSIPRAMLVVFPIWVRLARSRETVRWMWLSISAPVMVMISYFYLTGQWAG